jgi:hypothetical protein
MSDDSCDRVKATEEICGETDGNKRQCPSCEAVIDRTRGCDYMDCPNCHTRFCFRCSQKMPDDVNSCPRHECSQQLDVARRIDERCRSKGRVSTNLNDPDSYPVIVKTKDGQDVTVNVSKTGTGSDLKHAIYRKTGISPDQQHLSYAGQSITSDLRISRTTIRARVTVLLATQANGGLPGE